MIFLRRTGVVLALLAVISGCGSTRQDTAPAPLSPDALRAVNAKVSAPRESLARAIDRLFTDPAMAETRAVVILHNGRIVAERYAPGYHENTRFISWSMAKTITAVMIGQLVGDGRLRLDESAPVPAWQRPGDPRGEITLRQLLQMRSGLQHTEAGDPIYRSDEVRMLFLDGRDAMARYAEAQPLEAEPGAKWEYSSATSVILADIAARSLTSSSNPADRRRVIYDYLKTRLFEPLGMRSMLPEFDAAGTLIGGSLMHATARDWAKFGEFLRNKGTARGARLVSQGWTDFMLSPSPRNPGYGAQIWLNRPQVDSGRPEWPGAPVGTFSMNGHLGQYVVVSPDHGLTIVRLGKTPSAGHEAIRAQISKIIQLFGRSATPD